MGTCHLGTSIQRPHKSLAPLSPFPFYLDRGIGPLVPSRDPETLAPSLTVLFSPRQLKPAVPLHQTDTPTRLHETPLAPVHIRPSVSIFHFQRRTSFQHFVFSNAVRWFCIEWNRFYLRPVSHLDQVKFPAWDPFTSLRHHLWPLRHLESWGVKWERKGDQEPRLLFPYTF